MDAVRAIVFDFDGVLANSEPLHFRALQELLASLGVTLTEPDYYSTYVGYDDVGVFQIIAAREGWALDARQVARLVERKSEIFQDLTASADVLFPSAIPCIERLAPVFPLGIASGALRHEILTILRHHRLEDRFAFVVASGDTPLGKPAPDPYVRAAALHGQPASACLAIEDSRWGIESARAAGLFCVGVTTTYPATELCNADRVVDSLDAVDPDWVRRLVTE